MNRVYEYDINIIDSDTGEVLNHCHRYVLQSNYSDVVKIFSAFVQRVMKKDVGLHFTFNCSMEYLKDEFKVSEQSLF